ncbi:MAG: FtsX-like permease family protein [Clostridium chrysemydis]|uniref:FtsX-like permease family protein n=1 Tax=Clostridium chrysemydis TaxID=2665504 RepID=UPI003F3D3959
MKNALKSITRMKFLFFLIILQLSIGLYMVNSATAIIQDNTLKKKNFDKLFNFNNTYVARIIPENYGPNITTDYNKVNEFYKRLGDFKKQGLISRYSIVFPMLFEIPGIDKFLPEEFKVATEKTAIHRAKILVNNEFINNYDIKVVQGRTLNENDFNLNWNEVEIPILIGNAYVDKLNVGDIVTSNLRYKFNEAKNSMIKVKFKVVGIMEHNSIPTILAKSDFLENVVYSDYTVVIPSINDFFMLSPGVALGDQGVYIESNNIEEFERAISSELDSENMKINLYSLKSDYDGIMKELSKNIINSVLLGFTLLLLSLIGITVILLGELQRRKREFGIRLGCGATLSDLCKEIIFEVMYMMIFSSILSVVLMCLRNIGKNNFMSYQLVLVNIILITIFTFIISIIPVLKIKKMNVVELIRGK